MKILVDMNLSPGWVSFLAEAGFAAVAEHVGRNRSLRRSDLKPMRLGSVDLTTRVASAAPRWRNALRLLRPTR